MTVLRLRSLPVGPLRAFEALSRSLNFRLAGEELHLTQPAITRQIKLLEDQLGTTLFARDKRRVELTPAGATLLQAAGPWLLQLDLAVRQIRQSEGRRVVSINTFASLGSLWLIPRLASFRSRHSIDVRVIARDEVMPLEASGVGHIDAVLRYCHADDAPANAVRLFDDVLLPVVSPSLLERSRKSGEPLRQPSDLARQTLIEDLDLLPNVDYRSWYHWLRQQALGDLHPSRWLYFNYAHQQIQAALAGEGVALGRLPIVVDRLASGELIEPFARHASARLAAPKAYWLIAPRSVNRSAEAEALRQWIVAEAAGTRAAVAEYLSGTSSRKVGRR
jgi:LysR family glycine cleavage system transcriptional activator